jgi:hypothetical protein
LHFIKNHKVPLFIVLFTLLCLDGCGSKAATPAGLPSGLSVEEYQLTSAPGVEPLTFLPVQGTQEGILAKHQQERENTFPDDSVVVSRWPGKFVQLGNDRLETQLSYTPYETNVGTFEHVAVQVSRNGEVFYSIPAGDGSPINSVQGLWAYSNHWVLEIAYVTEKILPQNEISIDSSGQIVEDGELLNERHGYDEAFGFQLMDGRPFYFFQREGRMGISYDGQEVPLGYAQIQHHRCCSGSALNPRIARNMVAFFAQRDGDWYYVEIGVFK